MKNISTIEGKFRVFCKEDEENERKNVVGVELSIFCVKIEHRP